MNTATATDLHDSYCMATFKCECCDLPYIEEISTMLLEFDIPRICPDCMARAEEIAGEEELTELLADLEGDLYYQTIRDINRLLDGGAQLWN